MTSTTKLILAAIAVLGVTMAAELWMGRLLLGPDGQFGLLTVDIWSDAMSQRVADPYSLSHVLHGVLFYGLLWFVARRRPWGHRALAAVVLEAGWEILENSPIIINRYREVTIAIGYVGDSVLNSLSDVGMMALGFLLASRMPVWASMALFVGVELGMLVLIRDNLTLNVLMLIYPVDAILVWQTNGAPAGLFP